MYALVLTFDTMALMNASSSQGQIQSDTKDTFPRTAYLLLSFNRCHGNALSAIGPAPSLTAFMFAGRSFNGENTR
jgi:hypothetical protein